MIQVFMEHNIYNNKHKKNKTIHLIKKYNNLLNFF